MVTTRKSNQVSKKPRRSKPADTPEARQASLRAQIDAAVNDYQETIRLTKLYLDELERNPPRRKRGEKTIWEKIIELGEQIPPEELKNFPPDGAANLDHYLYGSPKQDPD